MEQQYMYMCLIFLLIQRSMYQVKLKGGERRIFLIAPVSVEVVSVIRSSKVIGRTCARHCVFFLCRPSLLDFMSFFGRWKNTIGRPMDQTGVMDLCGVCVGAEHRSIHRWHTQDVVMFLDVGIVG